MSLTSAHFISKTSNKKSCDYKLLQVFNLGNVRVHLLSQDLQTRRVKKKHTQKMNFPSCTRVPGPSKLHGSLFQRNRWQHVFLRLMTSHTTHNQQRPPGLQTLPLFSKPSSPHSLGEPSTWSRVSYSCAVCLHGVALAWYARVLSTVLAFYFLR